MLLVPCHKCSRPLSRDARTCSHCGTSRKRRVDHGSTGFLLLAFSTLLLPAGFSTNFAKVTMPRDVFIGAVVACASDAIPDMFAGAVAALDAIDSGGQCQPNWFRAIRYGMASVDSEIFVEAHPVVRSPAAGRGAGATSTNVPIPHVAPPKRPSGVGDEV